MQIRLRDAPEVLLPDRWRQFWKRFANKAAALEAITGPPARECGYHDNNDPVLPVDGQAKNEYAQQTFEIGNGLVGSFKDALTSGQLRGTGIIFHFVYEEGEDEPIDIPAEQWRRLWPVFFEDRAMGDARYENVCIHWDRRRTFASEHLQKLIVEWLRSQETTGLPKKTLYSNAQDRFGELPVRTFNIAYKAVFRRKLGRPRAAAKSR